MGSWSAGLLPTGAAAQVRGSLLRAAGLGNPGRGGQRTEQDEVVGQAPPGWYPDPSGEATLRFWEGTVWTSQTCNAAPRRHNEPPTGTTGLPGSGAAIETTKPTSKFTRYAQQQAVCAQVAPRADSSAQGARVQGRPAHTMTTPSKTVPPTLRAQALMSQGHGAMVRPPSRSARYAQLASTVLAAVAASALAYFGWVLVGTNVVGDLAQQHMQQVIAATTSFGPQAAGAQISAPVTEPSTRAASQPVSTLGPASAAHRQSTAAASRSTVRAAGQPAHAVPEFPPVGTPMGTIKIPAIGLDYAFSSGANPAQLAVGPGAWTTGAYPGAPGNFVMSGHRTTHGGYFYNLANLRYGDLIYIKVPGLPMSVYQVRGAAVVLPTTTLVGDKTAGARLTMTTCTPTGWATNRLVVEAELVKGLWASSATPASTWQTLAPKGDAIDLQAHPSMTIGQLDPTAQ